MNNIFFMIIILKIKLFYICKHFIKYIVFINYKLLKNLNYYFSKVFIKIKKFFLSLVALVYILKILTV